MTPCKVPGLNSAISAWLEHLGSDRVTVCPQTQERYGADTGGASRYIPAAVRPSTQDEVITVVRIAQAHGIDLHPISTGRNWGYGSALPARDGMVIVDLSGMNRILDFDPELGVVTVEPGVTQGMLHDYLRSAGHPYMVPTTGAGPDCSLMGNALQRGYGITPICDHWSAVTDLVAVQPDGTLFNSQLRSSGNIELARLHRWGTGPLQTGQFSQGSAGIVTEMSILLARRPRSIELAVFNLPNDEAMFEVVNSVRQLLNSLPGVIGGINLMNQLRVLAMTAPYPVHERGVDGVLPDATVAAMGRAYRVAPWTGIVTLYGEPEGVSAARRVIRRVLGAQRVGVNFLDRRMARWAATASRALPGAWGQRLAGRAGALEGAIDLASGIPNRTALPLAYWRTGRPYEAGVHINPAKDGCGLLWYAPLVPMRSSSVRNITQMIRSTMQCRGFEPLITLTSISDRLFDATTPILFDAWQPNEVAAANDLLAALKTGGAAAGCMAYRSGVVGSNQPEPRATNNVENLYTAEGAAAHSIS